MILENTLKENKKYTLGLTVKRAEETDAEEAKSTFYTNIPPYDGSCKAANISGTTDFIVLYVLY